jgi:hypothetical protein
VIKFLQYPVSLTIMIGKNVFEKGQNSHKNAMGIQGAEP